MQKYNSLTEVRGTPARPRPNPRRSGRLGRWRSADMDSDYQLSKQAEAYKYLYEIENSLRVAMHTAMATKMGLAYFNDAVFPPFEDKSSTIRKINLARKARALKKKEREYNLQFGYEYHHFWYIDYRELVLALEQYWDQHFSDIFNDRLYTKADIIGRLIRLSAFRNNIAHNRYISNIDLSEIRSVWALIRRSIKKDFLINYKSLAYNSQEEMIRAFSSAITDIKATIGKCLIVNYTDLQRLLSLGAYLTAILSEDAFGADVKVLKETIEAYNAIPRTPGNAPEINRFINSSNLNEKVENVLRYVGE
jgi:hypothetical protein